MNRPAHHRAHLGLLGARRILIALLSLALPSLLVACGSSNGSTPDDDASGTASSEPEPYLEVPADVALTLPGSGLKVGDKAMVAWEPRENQIGALGVQVSKIQLISWKSFSGWQLDAATRAMLPYFVHAKITNVGDIQLGDTTVPLYGLDTTGVLVEPSRFADRFGPCPGNGTFQEKFPPKASSDVCLVYLVAAGRTLRGVSFRPTQEFDQITWTGPIDQPKKSTRPKKARKKP